jgi:hypothetical protein
LWWQLLQKPSANKDWDNEPSEHIYDQNCLIIMHTSSNAPNSLSIWSWRWCLCLYPEDGWRWTEVLFSYGMSVPHNKCPYSAPYHVSLSGISGWVARPDL